MSTVGQVKPAPVAKYESFVEEKLARARKRIRALDTAAALLGWLIVTLVYGLGMALVDRWLELPALPRQIGFALYGLVAAGYLAVVLIRPLFGRVNPYYAAREVERAVPGAKNSVVNWLDLRQQQLPPAIRGAISHRAARDLGRADLEQAISARRTGWLGGVTLALSIALAILFFSGPRQFFSLLERAFTPFQENTLRTRTSLEIVEPAGGDVTIPVGRAVSVTVHVEGKVPDPNKPDALKLLYRYHPNENYEEQPLQPGDSSREWGTLVAAFQVHNGFWYKVAGGDAETAEYRVQVRSAPLLTDFEVKYHFRPYLLMPDQVSHDPNLVGMRGAAITLVTRANRAVKTGRLEFSALRKSILAEPGQDPQAMRFQFVLDQDDTYRIWFTSTEGESNSDPMPYTIKVLRDQAPRVELTKPGKNIRLPANGVLQLEGWATDDFGLTALTLQMKVNGEQAPQAKPYRPGKSFQLAAGGYPQRLEYKDFVDLSKVRLLNGDSLHKRDVIIEYWLEAKDNCDYPEPNVTRSQPTFTVTIEDPEQNDKKRQEQRQQAQQEQKQHEQKQDQKLKQESEERKQQDKPDQSNVDQQKAAQDQQKPDAGEDRRQFENAIKEEQEKSKGEHKGSAQEERKGSEKGEGRADGAAGPPQEKAEGKSQPKPQDRPGEPKGQTKGADGTEKQPNAESKPGPQNSKPGSDQTAAQKQNAVPGEHKPEPRPDEKQDMSQTKPGNAGDGSGAPGTQKGSDRQNQGSGQQPKAQDKPQPQQQHNAAQPKGDGQKKEDSSGGQGGGNQPGQPKPDNQVGKAEPKGPGKKSAAGAPQGEPKNQAATRNDESPKGAGKPAGEKGKPENANVAKGTAKGDQSQPKADNGRGSGAEKPQPNREISDLAKKLQSKDQKTREQALQRLEELRDKAKDAEVRQAAADALKNARPLDEQKNATPGTKQPDAGATRGKGELADLIKKLQSKDETIRKQAVRRLEELRDEAKDKDLRQAAADALKKMGPESGTNTGAQGNKPAEGGTGHNANDENKRRPEIAELLKKLQSKDDKDRQEARQKLEQLRQNAADKDLRQAASDALNNAKEGKPPENGEAGTQRSQRGTGQKTDRDDRPDQQNQASTGRGAGPNNTPRSEREETPDQEPESGAPANPKYQKQAGEKQLENFKKHKDIAIKKLGWSEEKWAKFIKDLEDEWKREEKAPSKPEKLVDPKRGGGVLPNRAARQVKGADVKDDNLPHSSQVHAAPGFEEAQREFTQKNSQPRRSTDNK